MRRAWIVVAFVVLVIGGVAGGPTVADAWAQEGTPAPAGSTGATLEPVGVAPAVELPPGRAALLLLRLSLERDGRFASDGDPALSLIALESGRATARVGAAVQLLHLAEGRPAPPEALAAGTEFALEPGDSFVWPPGASLEIRNAAQGPSLLLLATLAPRGEAAATPAP